MNVQKLVRAGSLLVLLFSLSIASVAQRGRGEDRRRGDDDRWISLGQSRVDGRRDHDRVIVNRAEKFRALQLGVRGGAIEFQRVVVHFDNGEDHELQIRDRIEEGGRTRSIDLPGERRRIRSVEFWYSKGSWRSRPYVTVWGQHGGDRR